MHGAGRGDVCGQVRSNAGFLKEHFTTRNDIGCVLGSLIRLLPIWSILYVPVCYVSCNVMRHVDSPTYTIREAILIAAYAYTPVALLDALSHLLSRALGTYPPMLVLGDKGDVSPEWLSHFAISMVRAFWTPLAAFSLWGAFLAYWQRTAQMH